MHQVERTVCSARRGLGLRWGTTRPLPSTEGSRHAAARRTESPMSLILEEMHGTVLVLTLNRPDRLNAVVPELFEELSDVLTQSAGKAGAVVLTGAGRGFCVGGDIRAPKSD